MTVNDLEPLEEDVKSEGTVEVDPSRASLDLNIERESLAEQAVRASTHRPMSPVASASHVSGSYQVVSLLSNQIE